MRTEAGGLDQSTVSLRRARAPSSDRLCVIKVPCRAGPEGKQQEGLLF
jgi:hypothetical protein